MRSERAEFMGSHGSLLAAKLDLPDGAPRAYALFAHCFTCTKDYHITSQISSGLTEHGIAVLRFDFTGLGNSEGDFSNTNFSSNIDDLLKASEWLAEHHQAPALLLGHSFGGAAVLAAAHKLPSVKAVATIAAPSEPEHVLNHFPGIHAEIEANGEAEIKVGGHPFRIRKQFVEDVASHKLADAIANLHRPLMVFHSPTDAVVGIENAAQIFAAAKHPKSFISLDKADHLLRGKEHAQFVATMLATWFCRYF